MIRLCEWLIHGIFYRDAIHTVVTFYLCLGVESKSAALTARPLNERPSKDASRGQRRNEEEARREEERRKGEAKRDEQRAKDDARRQQKLKDDARRALQSLANAPRPKGQQGIGQPPRPQEKPVSRSKERDNKNNNNSKDSQKKSSGGDRAQQRQKPRFQRPPASQNKRPNTAISSDRKKEVADLPPTAPPTPPLPRPTRTGLPPRRKQLFARPSPSSRGGSSGQNGRENSNRPAPPGKLIIEEVTGKKSQAAARGQDAGGDDRSEQALTEAESKKFKERRNQLLKNMRSKKGQRPRPKSPAAAPTPRSNSAALENLVNIAKSPTKKAAEAKIQENAAVTSKQQRRKKKKKVIRPSSSQAKPPPRDLSPQQRSLQKVKETLNNTPGATAADEANLPPRPPPAEDKHSRRKIVLRKKKNPSDRQGRQIQDDSKFKHFKVRVRRPLNPEPFPIRH